MHKRIFIEAKFKFASNIYSTEVIKKNTGFTVFMSDMTFNSAHFASVINSADTLLLIAFEIA